MNPTTEPVPVGKLVAPLARQLAETMAVEVGACVRPLAVRRTDTHTPAGPPSCRSRTGPRWPPSTGPARSRPGSCASGRPARLAPHRGTDRRDRRTDARSARVDRLRQAGECLGYLVKYLTKPSTSATSPRPTAPPRTSNASSRRCATNPARNAARTGCSTASNPTTPRPAWSPAGARTRRTRPTPRLLRPPPRGLAPLVRQEPHRAPRRAPQPRPARARRRRHHPAPRHRRA